MNPIIPHAVKHSILIIEDEPGIIDTLIYSFESEGFSVLSASTGREGLELLNKNTTDLVILDIGLPDASGLDVLKEIRKFSNVPVLFLTARSGEIDRILGLELGADDYVVKPFSPREVVSRVKAVLRRSLPETPVTGRDTVFSVDGDRRIITYFGEKLHLPRYEFEILRLLVSRPGWVFTRDMIMDLVWEEPGESFDRTVDAHIKSIRGKLRTVRPDIDPIVTHRGIGYALREELCR